MFATTSNLRKMGYSQVANLIVESTKSPTRAKNILKTYRELKNANEKINSNEASAILLNCELSKYQFISL